MLRPICWAMVAGMRDQLCPRRVLANPSAGDPVRAVISCGRQVEVHCGGVPLGRSYCRGDKSQEQIQIITSAIGKAATKATTIVEVNALSKFSSWRTLSTDILLAPPRGSQNAVAGTMP